MSERAERAKQLFAYPVLIAALAVIPVIAIEQTDVGQPWKTIGAVLNWGSWLVFLSEAIVLFVLVEGRLRWLRDHAIEVALVFITPPWLPPGLQSLRVVRLLRLLRLLRVPQLMRGLFSLNGLRFASFLALMTVIGGAVAFEVIHPGSVGGSVRWRPTLACCLFW